MTPPANTERYKHHRFPGEIISPGVWLYYGIVNLLRLIPSSGQRVCYPGPLCLSGSPLRACDLSPTLELTPHLLTVRGR
jgi:hypothetical protein